MNFLYSWTNKLYQTFAGPNVENTWDVRDALRTDALKDLSKTDSRETPAATRKSSMSIRVVSDEEEEEEEEEEEYVDPEAIASAEDERIHAEDAGYAASMRKEAYDICMDRTTADTKSRILEDMYAERLTDSLVTDTPKTLVMRETVAHTDRTKTKAKHSLTSDLTVYKVTPSVHPDDWLLPCIADADFTDALRARKEHEEHVRKTMHAVARDICVDALAPLSSHLQLTDSSAPPTGENKAADKCVTCTSFIVGHVEHRLAHRVGKETLLHVEHNLDKARQVLLQYCDECIITMVVE